MGPTTPEQNPPEKSMQQQAQEAFDKAMVQIKSSYNDRFAEIARIEDEGERTRARAELAQQAKVHLDQLREQAVKEPAPGATDKPEDIKRKSDDAKRTFFETKYLSDNDVNVVNKKSQLLVDKIVENIKSGELTDRDVLDIERNLGRELINGVVFSGPNDQLSTTEEGLRDLLQVNQKAAGLVFGNVAANPETYGTTVENLRQKLIPSEQESQETLPSEQRRRRPIEESRFGGEDNYYSSRFTDEQLELISTFYSPERFIDYMERLSNGDDRKGINSTPAEVQKRKQDIEHHIKDYYEKNHKDFKEGELEEQVEKHWGEEVSERMNWRVSDIINQLFLELQQKSPHKFYEEIMQEDIFQGPAMIQKRIQAAINSLMTKVGQIETHEDDPLYQRLEKIKPLLYRHTADKPWIDERDGKKYPRLKPLPYGENISTSDFIQYLNLTIDHTIHKAEYFHNSRAIYGHPAGEKGFYNQLGGFAENMRGTDIDEIMLLPDGQYIMQAYQLYEKFLEEDFASLDWRHRPDQFQNQLERVNSKLEIEIFDQLKNFYPDLTKERVRNIVNSAVGISRGMFLTEAEKSAYADPVDAEGKGMVASYSTNDAQSLNVFNPLHNALRWQGEHNWNMMYFMPVAGQPGKMWEHKKSWNNMARYMDTFIAGKGRGAGKDELPELFADAMMDINNVGGPNKRKGWRMNYSFDGHYVWDPDNTINAPKTFKAMEAIGYEGIAHLISSDGMWKKILEATEKTAPEQVKERQELFSYIYERYFSDDPNKFQESDLDNYLNKLRGDGEKQVLKKIKENKGTTSIGDESIIKGSWEEQVAYETSKLFLKNTLAHYVAARMPTKFLRIDRNRFTENGVSRWERIQKELNKDKGWDIAKFDLVMKDLTMTEMLFRREISNQIREQMSFNKDLALNEIENLPSKLDEAMIRKLLSKDSLDKNEFKSAEEIQRVVDLWRHINKDYNNEQFLDGEGAAKIKEYKFTFGLEDTDISLIPYRGTGPRMIARAIKDIGSIEATVTPWLLNMPAIMSEIAVNGKHDFSGIIEYMRKAQKALFDVHGTGDTQEFIYKLAGTVINYFKKDGMAKPLFGLFRLGQRNSIAAEYAGRSTAVWEWDSRDIDRFAVALESYRLLPKNAYDLNLTKGGKFIGGQPEDRWIKLPGLKPFKFGKKRHEDWKWNAAKLRKEHGADIPAIAWDMFNQFVPLAIAFLLWKYIKDAMDEASGKKKQ